MTSLHLLVRPRWASGNDLVPAYERAFVRTLMGHADRAAACGRGRVALWTILRSLGVDQTSEVIVPAYTCETVPMAVKFAGAKCVYGDVDEHRFNVSLRKVIERVSERTRVVICQHTYGIVQPVGEWVRWAADRDIALIEDRCQMIQNGVGGYAEPLLSDAAYFSTHVNKPFSTTQGGMAVFRDPTLYAVAQRVQSAFPSNGDRQRIWFLALQTFLLSVAVRPATRAILGQVYRWAQRSGLIRGTISADEYRKAMPSDYLSRATNLHAVLGIAQLTRWKENCRHREEISEFYIERLDRLGIDTSPLKRDREPARLLMVPLLVDNKDEMLKKAALRALPIGTWFDRHPAHLRPESAPMYDYCPGDCPNTERLIAKEIHLLTAPWVSHRHATRAIRFIERYARRADPYPTRPAARPGAARWHG